ncbi:MAG: DUF2510 domain-containing protein [Actinobacteria bacterium]|nr:DUF2510 domain-containing protein [Actinomycetota bacterium]
MTRPGWYEDPWRQAPLRWWDGEQWSAETTGPPPFEELVSAPPAATSVFERLLAAGDRVAVIDVETTGLHNADRIVEIGIVTIDATGTVIDEFETLVNPRRDLGPTWLHQVTASMVADAPTFDDIAHHVAARLDGAVCAAHNLPFDARMIGNEFTRVGLDIQWGHGLDTLAVTGCKLSVACDDYGIVQASEHRALHDAQAVAGLLIAVADAFTPGSCIPARTAPLSVTPIRVHTREGHADAQVPVPYLAALARGVHATVEVAPYVDLLDAAVADLKLTEEERSELADLADHLGLDDTRVARAHREFIDGLIDAAIEDDVVTDEEYDQLCRAAALLDVEPALIARRTDGYRSESGTMALEAGMTVCFTGEAVTDDGVEIPRSDLESLATAHGLIPVRSVTKKTSLLIAADAATRSGKAAKARSYGIPIGSVVEYLSAIHTGAPLNVSRLSSGGVALVCVTCGDSWLAARRSDRPLCADCRAAKRSASTKSQTSAMRSTQPSPRPAQTVADGNAVHGPAVETLVCAECGRSWERARVRGRKPHRCPDCAT